MTNNHLNDIVNISNQLVRAVECLQSPNAAPYERNEAYTICEQFKDSSPVCIPCAIYLLEHDSHLVRHFGLQLMEHCVKYKWYQVELEEKLAIREKSIELLDRRCAAVAEYTHLKDGLARVMVEMIKREWPQQWPELFPSLFEIAYNGNCVQAELVLLILLRLVEDVAVLHTLQSPQRRKDLYHSLSLQLENIFGFLLNLMQKYYELALMNGENDAVRVVRLNLMVLFEFIEWAPLHRILADNGKIVHVLAVVIMNGDFCVEAVDCFLQILRRRGGKQEELYSVAQSLFSTNLIDQFFEASDRRNAILLLNGRCSEFGEREYDFAKKTSALLLSIANFLNLLTEKCDSSFELFLQKNALIPHKLEMYLKILIDLCEHSSYVVLCNVVAAWRIVFRNSSLNKMPAVLEHIPTYINYIVPKIVRVPYGVNATAVGNESGARTWLLEAKKFISLDFETEDSYVKFIYRFRNELVPTLRSACELAPHIVYLYIEQMVTSCIASVTASSSSSSSPSCDVDYYYLRWEPLTVTIDAVFTHFPTTYSPPLENGLRLIDLCLNVQSRDPVILTNLLTCLSNFMVFMRHASPDTVTAYLPKIIDFVVACLVFRPPLAAGAANDFNANGVSHNGGLVAVDNYRILKDLHTAAGGFMVRTSVHYPGLLLPFFEYIYVIYNRLKHETRQLSKSEDVLLLEALVSISNDFRDFERQSTFVATVVESNIESHWKETRVFLQSEPEFARFIGLDVDQQSESCFENRLKLMYTIELLSAIVLRCGSTKERARCGFVRDCGDKNPATARLLPLLPDIFMLVRVLNGLWSSDDATRAKLTHPVYANIFDISDSECRMLNEAINVCPSSGSTEKEDDCDFGRQKNFPTRMQNFLYDLYQKCFLLLSRSSERFGRAFYDMPNFPGSFIASVFYNIDRMPDYRLRTALKHFMKPLVWHCPPSHYDQVLIPILEHFTVHMSERLNNRWNYLNECRLHENNVVDDLDKGGGGGGSDNISANNKEMIERLLITQLSREYMDLVKTVLVSAYTDSGVGRDADKMNANASGSLSNLHSTTGTAFDSVSELGEKALNNSAIAPALLSFLLPAISWDDSLNSSKAVTMMPMIVKQLIASYPLNVTPELAAKILIHLLQGIQVHGEHDSNIGSLLYTTIAAYEMLRPNSANLPEILAMVPGINLDELRKFDENVLKNGIKEKISKGKREHFKKLVSALIGQNVGQLFKRKEHFRDLPRMLNRTKNNNSSVDVLNSFRDSDIIGISNLFR